MKIKQRRRNNTKIELFWIIFLLIIAIVSFKLLDGDINITGAVISTMPFEGLTGEIETPAVNNEPVEETTTEEIIVEEPVFEEEVIIEQPTVLEPGEKTNKIKTPIISEPEEENVNFDELKEKIKIVENENKENFE